MGRFAGARTLGGYLAFAALVRLVGIAVSFGQPWYVLRSIAQSDERGDPHGARAILQGSIRTLTRTYALVAAIGVPIALAVVLARGHGGAGAVLLVLTALSVGGLAFGQVGIDALKARGRTQSALFLEFSIAPAFVIVWAAMTSTGGGDATIAGLAGAHTLGTLVSAGGSYLLWARDHRVRFGSAKPGVSGEPVAPQGRSLFSFGVTNLLVVAGPSLPQVLLPFVMTLADVGRVGAAIRLTSIPGVLVVGLSSLYAPRFARLAVAGDRPELRKALRESQTWIATLFLPFAVAFILVPEMIVPVLGPDFAGTETALRILGIGQLVNALTGLAPMLLNMCNAEVYVVMATSVSVVGMGAATIVAGATWGVVGAATGYAGVVALRNALIYGKALRVIRSGPLVPDRAVTQAAGTESSRAEGTV
ncbi:MAG TPA: hypothetical protein VG602_03330 [Actinomycetota bacterium]|nr:hypothetical protein [Actinomycetota bacterium]